MSSTSIKTFLTFFFFGMSLVLLGQADKNLYKAENYFKIKNYEQAAANYQLVVDDGKADGLTYYRLGYSYMQFSEIVDQIKSIPYFEKAVAAKSKDVPFSVHFELGKAYQLNSDINKALESLRTYKKEVLSDKAKSDEVDNYINQCSNAVFYLNSPVSLEVKPFGGTANSEYTEYNPVISADESVMAFTAVRKDSRTGALSEKIMISYNEAGNWTEPAEVNLKASGNIGTAGLSPDGQQMMVFIGSTGGIGNLYTTSRQGKEWDNPVNLGTSINSRFLESTASISPDGKTIYFASNRPGGYGGFDLYTSKKDSKGVWSKPENLGPRINTKFDEDAPFIHPDQKTLFFTSSGHTSIGGKDIFKTVLNDNQWSKPYNMGFPINTTANDNYFTLTADGRTAYFSSDRLGGKGQQDIYTVAMPEGESNIPLTMIKGRILNGETMRPIPTKIYLIDKQTNSKLDFVYNPNPKTGDYLIILPPSKNYDMVIESEEFLPYTININIPNQTYFYELYQMIFLKTIEQFDVKVGQEVIVKNAFYDTNQDAVADMRKAHEAALLQTDSIDAYDLMADLMAAEDQEGIAYIIELLMMNNPIDNVDFDEKTNSNLEAATRTYYYDESDESKFEQKEIDGNIILSLPTFYVTEEAQKRKALKKEVAKIDPKVLSKKVTIYFDAGKSEMNAKYNAELDALLEVLKTNENLYIEISGYASAEGDEAMNRELSNKRAIGVLEYLNHRGVVRRRIIARGYGATRVEASNSKEQSRRVEIKLVPAIN